MEHILTKTKEYVEQNIYKIFKSFDDFLKSEYFGNLFIKKAGNININLKIIETNDLTNYIIALHLNCMQYHISHKLQYDDAMEILRNIVFKLFISHTDLENSNKTLLYYICLIYSYSKKDIACKSLEQYLKSNFMKSKLIYAGDDELNNINDMIDVKQNIEKKIKKDTLINTLSIITYITIGYMYNFNTNNVYYFIFYMILIISMNAGYEELQQIEKMNKGINKTLKTTLQIIKYLHDNSITISDTYLNISYSKQSSFNSSSFNSLVSIPLLKSSKSSKKQRLKNVAIHFQADLLNRYLNLLHYMIDSKISQYYMKINDVSNYDNYMTEHGINTLTKKGILYPPNILDTLTMIHELSILSSKKYTSIFPYGSNRGYKWIFNLFDILNLNILYLYKHKGKYYFSPLNSRKTRDELRKQPLESFRDILLSDEYYDELLKPKGPIDCSKYHLILIHNDNYIAYSSITEVQLNNFDKKHDFRACYIRNKNRNHIMSISKCNYKNIINSTWEESSTYYIEDENLDILPEKPKHYMFSNNDYKILLKSDVDEKLKENEENGTYIYSFPFDSDNIFKSFALFVPSTIKSAGTKIPDDDKCKDIFFEINRTGTCWFTSLINVMFFSDDISSLCLYQSMKAMPKTLKYIDKYVYENENKSIKKFNPRKHVNHVFYLITFIYSSYYILSKNQFEKIKYKKKWLKIMAKLSNPEFNTKLSLFLITTKH